MFIRCSKNFLFEPNQEVTENGINIFAVRCSTRFGRCYETNRLGRHGRQEKMTQIMPSLFGRTDPTGLGSRRDLRKRSAWT